MPNDDNQSIATPGQEPVDANAVAPAGTTPSDDPNAETPNPEASAGGEQEDTLPEWARKNLTKARSDAARYRTELREAQERLQGAKTVEEFQAATTDLNTKIASLEREVVARSYGLPDALANRLQGATREELEADAKQLQQLIAPAAPVDPTPPPYKDGSGGLNPGELEDPDAGLSPLELAKRYSTHKFRI